MIQEVVCPDGYVFVRSHERRGKLISGFCRKSDKEKKKELARETISAIPFGYDAVVVDDYARYGEHRNDAE